MKAHTRILVILLALASTLISAGRFLPAGATDTARSQSEWIRFRVTTIEESGGQRNIISDATVEGPAGTDFAINLQGERFKMSARFLTDLINRDSLKMRAKLDTRRFYGYSEHELPLYEEDKQKETLELGFDESVVLLPFGRGGGDSLLKIEITPTVSKQETRLASGKTRPLEINILKPSPGGSIGIHAWKIPHRFTVQATLLEDGREVAEGGADCLLEEPQELILKPTGRASPEVINNQLVVNFRVNHYTRSRPADLATIGFDIYRAGQHDAGREAIGMNWAGIGEIGSGLSYDLNRVYMTDSGKKYELRFKINLAAGERAD